MIQISGAEAIRRAFRNMGPKIRSAVNREVVRSALNIQGAAKRNAPVDTGRLRNSIAAADSEALLSENGEGRLSADTTEAVIGTRVSYAPFVEFGTRHQEAQPFLVSAWEAERDAFARRLAAVLGFETGGP